METGYFFFVVNNFLLQGISPKTVDTSSDYCDVVKFERDSHIKIILTYKSDVALIIVLLLFLL